MATPTPTNSAVPGAKGPQNAATPTSHPHLTAFSSPAPRGAPSPAQLRQQQAARSPFNAAHRDGTIGNLLGASAAPSFKMPTSSPAAGMLNTESPAAMLYSLSSLDNAIPMGLSISNLGAPLGSLHSRVDGDEERRRKLVEIIAIIGRRAPRIGIEGIQLLAKRAGMETEVNDDRRTGRQTVTVAGNTVLIDIHFDEHSRVYDAEVQFPTSSDLVTEQAKSASALLLKTLTPGPNSNPLNADLAQFALNLDYLGRLDKLSILQPSNTSFNCFEAISGIHKSLHRLFEHEKAAALELIDGNKSHREERAVREVMCKKSGRPSIHRRDRLGLRLDYWTSRRYRLPRHQPNAQQPVAGSNANIEDAMQVDEEKKTVALSDDADIDQDIFSLLIECEALKIGNMSSAPARIASSWIDDIVRRADLTEANLADPAQAMTEINWLDPLPTYTKPLEQPPNDTMSLDDPASLGSLPNVSFVAKLDPPLVVQYYLQPTASTAAMQDQFTGPTRTFAGLLLEPEGIEDLNARLTEVSSAYAIKTRLRQRLLVMDGTETEEVQHETSLWVSKPDVAKVIEEITFSHPRELIEVLPKLRQYAQTNKLLKDAFEKSKEIESDDYEAELNVKDMTHTTQPRERSIQVDLCSTLEPSTRICVSFGELESDFGARPNRSDQRTTSEPSHDKQINLDDFLARLDDAELDDSTQTSSVVFEILPNADIQIIECQIVGSKSARGEGSAEDLATRVGKVAQALDVAGDLGIWVEWMALYAERL